MGLCSNCWCCSCLPRKKSILVCTWIYMIIYFLFALIFFGGYCSSEVKNKTAKLVFISFLFPIALGVSLVLLFVILGLKKNKKEYLVHFKWCYGTYLVIEAIILVLVNSGLLFIIIFFANESLKNNIFDLILLILYIMSVIIYHSLNWNYFLFTSKYINEIINDDDFQDIKSIESGNKPIIVN